MRGVYRSSAEGGSVGAALIYWLWRMQEYPAQVGFFIAATVKPQYDKHYDDAKNEYRVFKGPRASFFFFRHMLFMIPQLSELFLCYPFIAPRLFAAVRSHDVWVGAFAGN